MQTDPHPALLRRTLRAERRRRHRTRLTATLAVASGVVLGGLLTSGAAAAAAELPIAADTSVAPALQEVADEAQAAVDAAQTALTDADALVDEVAQSGLDVGGDAEVDTALLSASLQELDDAEGVQLLRRTEVVEAIDDHADDVTAETAHLRSRFGEAQQKKAEADAAAAAARAEAEAAAALAAGNTVEGAKSTAAHLAATQYGWGGDQFQCLDSLWQKESDWNYQAVNPSSGATGIPQSLPGDKMAAAGPDWQTNATTQIRWGLDYISRAYGTPCAAWAHSQATDWY
ncbi:phospholipase [Microbacterium sp. zg.Y1090]|uniref:aggregation-promoting factor C-terminal-like domain-containing protein n=1 Tax=Microbacterium TaxID=33882 RepID=UPI00214AF6FF|nr:MULTISPECIES: phospholipase [unclassified Microbacterium]MCR2812481.1 phospholipase [Microbacterium sp. zg.Y1084]MCR2817718.1 phospholipase [Microbacterium sp. zg.Y1090]MDL5485639.1 phospholipase [Microbacterium sp. zg-Y1211]WIM28810.1 phospholipase [Microbacterium sp. zg-Y1090]